MFVLPRILYAVHCLILKITNTLCYLLTDWSTVTITLVHPGCVDASKNVVELVLIRSYSGHMTDCLVSAPHTSYHVIMHARNVQMQQPTFVFYLMPSYQLS